MRLSARLEHICSELAYFEGRRKLGQSFKDYFSEAKYVDRDKILMVLGPGRSGKDTVANFIARNTNLTFTGSSSKYLCQFVAQGYYEEFYSIRHDYKEMLFDLGNAIRDYELSLIPITTLAYNDILCGLRDGREVEYIIKSLKPASVLWIHRNVPEDITMGFTLLDVNRYCIESNTRLDHVSNNTTKAYLYGCVSNILTQLDVELL